MRIIARAISICAFSSVCAYEKLLMRDSLCVCVWFGVIWLPRLMIRSKNKSFLCIYWSILANAVNEAQPTIKALILNMNEFCDHHWAVSPTNHKLSANRRRRCLMKSTTSIDHTTHLHILNRPLFFAFDFSFILKMN